MQRSATRTGPGIERVPASQRPTVASSTSSAAAVSRRFIPSDAIAARSSSADNDAILTKGQTVAGQDRPQRVEGVVLGKRVGQAAVAAEQGQALRTVNAAGDKADCIGGESGNGLGLVHAPYVVPMASHVNGEMP